MAENGADPIGMTMKEMVTEMYRDMKDMRTDVRVLTQADLPRRVNDLESFRDGMAGGSARLSVVDTTVRGWLSSAVAVVAAGIALVALLTK